MHEQEEKIAAALDRLSDLDGIPIPEQVATYEDLHVTLQAALADTDQSVDNNGSQSQA
jgi:hypothetical protein